MQSPPTRTEISNTFGFNARNFVGGASALATAYRQVIVRNVSCNLFRIAIEDKSPTSFEEVGDLAVILKNSVNSAVLFILSNKSSFPKPDRTHDNYPN
jgi:hypothetical protein